MALISALTLGISNSLYKQSSDVLSPISTTFYYYIFSAILAAIVWTFWGDSKEVHTSSLIWPALIAIFLFISVLSFNFAITQMTVSMGATIRALSFVVTVLIGVAWYRDSLSWQQMLAVVFSISAVLLAGMGNTDGAGTEPTTAVPVIEGVSVEPRERS
ncbi:MAG: DMT family transporter [Deltaproteobacteria bacterium]|nr:DMT family transporter [Deltaproteobacteria bacterium]